MRKVVAKTAAQQNTGLVTSRKSITFQSSSGQPPPTAPPPQGNRPLQPLSPSSLRAFSVSGRRLKSLKQPAAAAAPTPSASHHQQRSGLRPPPGLHEPLQQQRISLSSAGNRTVSRLSMNGPVHWGELERIKTLLTGWHFVERVFQTPAHPTQMQGTETDMDELWIEGKRTRKMHQCRAFIICDTLVKFDHVRVRSGRVRRRLMASINVHLRRRLAGRQDPLVRIKFFLPLEWPSYLIILILSYRGF